MQKSPNTVDDRVAWASFEDLVTAINEAIEIDEEWLASRAGRA